jgi:transcriptional regulator with XRE-family HTH domain
MPSQGPRHIKSIVAGNLKAARESQGKRQLDVALGLGIDPTYVSRWERAQVMPSLENLHALAEVYGRDVAWFYVEHKEAA